MSAGLTGRADMLAHCWVRAMAPGWKSRSRRKASASCGAIFARAARTPSVSRARCARKPKPGASMVFGAGSGATSVIEKNDNINTVYRSTSTRRGQPRPSPRRSITMPSPTPTLFSNLRNILVKTGKPEWLRAYSHRKIMKRLHFYEASPYSSGAGFTGSWRMSMSGFTRRTGLLVAAGAAAAGALALMGDPPPGYSQQKRAALELNQSDRLLIDRFLSQATITALAKNEHYFNVKVKAAEYDITFHLQMEKGPVPHRASLSCGVLQSDGVIMTASLSQSGPGSAINYPSSDGYNGALARRTDVRPVFLTLFAEGRAVADELLKSVPPGERATLDPQHPRIRHFARELLAAAWFANPSHPGHRQVSELNTKLTK